MNALSNHSLECAYCASRSTLPLGHRDYLCRNCGKVSVLIVSGGVAWLARDGIAAGIDRARREMHPLPFSSPRDGASNTPTDGPPTSEQATDTTPTAPPRLTLVRLEGGNAR